MMSSLLFYHKKGENPLTLAIENEGRWWAQAVLLGVDLDGEKNCHE